MLRVVGAGPVLKVDGLEIDNREWTLEREINDFSSIDIGIYPIFGAKALDPKWIEGKSGFKAIEYMAVGVPFVMSPVGVCADLGTPCETHFNAVSPEDWYNSLDKLLADEKLRTEMGARGRKFSVENFDLHHYANLLADILRAIV